MALIPFNFSRDAGGAPYRGVQAPDVAGAIAGGGAAMGRAVSGIGGVVGDIALERMREHKAQMIASEMTRASMDLEGVDRDYDLATAHLTDPERLIEAKADAETRAAEVRDTLRQPETKLAFDNHLMKWKSRLADRTQARQIEMETNEAAGNAQLTIAGGIENGSREHVDAGVARLAWAKNMGPEETKALLEEKRHAMSLTQARIALQQFETTKYATPEDLDRDATGLKERIDAGEVSQFKFLTPEDKANAAAAVDRIADGLKRDQDANRKKALAEHADAVGASVVDLLTRLDAGDLTTTGAGRAQVELAIQDGVTVGALKKEDAARYRRALDAGRREVDTDSTLAAVEMIHLQYTMNEDADAAMQALFEQYQTAGPRTRGQIGALFRGIANEKKQAAAAAGKATARTTMSALKANRKAGYKMLDDAMKTGVFGNVAKSGPAETDKLRREEMTKALGKAKTPAAKGAAREMIMAKWAQQDAAFTTAKQTFDAWLADNPTAPAADVQKQVSLVMALPLEDAAFQSLMRRLSGTTILDNSDEE